MFYVKTPMSRHPHVLPAEEFILDLVFIIYRSDYRCKRAVTFICTQLAPLSLFSQLLECLLASLRLDFTANVARFNLFRFAGRPGKYNKLFNRWRLEEVSAIRRRQVGHLLPRDGGKVPESVK